MLLFILFRFEKDEILNNKSCTPLKGIVKKSENRLIYRDSDIQDTEMYGISHLLELTDRDVVLTGGDGICTIRFFAERDNAITACQQDAKTKDESLTVRVDITLI